MTPAYSFADRHVGPTADDTEQMLSAVGASTLQDLISETIPHDILLEAEHISAGKSENEYLEQMRTIARENRVYRSFIGLDACHYYGEAL